MSTSKTVSRALDRPRQPGAKLVLMHDNDSANGYVYVIWPGGGRISDETARALLERPDI